MDDNEDKTLSRRAALARLGLVATAGYLSPLMTTVTFASGGSDDASESSAASESSVSSESSLSSDASEPSVSELSDDEQADFDRCRADNAPVVTTDDAGAEIVDDSAFEACLRAAGIDPESLPSMSPTL